MTTFHTANVAGLDVFYRQAGDPSRPKLLLLGGFPSSSHQFRNLMPALADRFHVLSLDYPGVGNTDMPDPALWDCTFDHRVGEADRREQAVNDLGQVGETGGLARVAQRGCQAARRDRTHWLRAKGGGAGGPVARYRRTSPTPDPGDGVGSRVVRRSDRRRFRRLLGCRQSAHHRLA